MIEARSLTKRYGEKLAVDHLSFSVEAGKITGFLGPNGAGKTTTMRLILGLDHPSAGTVTVNGKAFRQLAHPMREVGALLDAKAVHGGRSAYSHLLCLAQTNNLPARRVGEVLELVGLSEVARKRSKGFSLGMGQRLGIAGALLGDPAILMFDEPVNGLDPEGILWIRNLMKALAAEGRTVFVSSHLMSEMEHTADHLIVIGRGQLIADCTMSEFIAGSSGAWVRVRTPSAEAFVRAITAQGATAATDQDGAPGGGQFPEEPADPVDALRVQAVDRFVEHQHLRVAEQRGGDAETLAHAEGESLRSLTRHLRQADKLKHLTNPPPGQAVGLGQAEQVAVGTAAAVDRLGVQQGAHLPHRLGQLAEVLAVHGDGALGGAVQPQDESHGGGLARPVRAEEAGDLAWLHAE